jgi:cardiolipin synthase
MTASINGSSAAGRHAASPLLACARLERLDFWAGTVRSGLPDGASHGTISTGDSRWARVGSTNLNVASWLGNRELDVVVEHEPFAREMEEMFLRDLENATEVVLRRNRVRAPGAPAGHPRRATGASSGGRVMAGAARVGNTVAASITNTRVLAGVESNIALIAGTVLAVVAALAFMYPRAIAYPLGVFAAWVAAAILYRGAVLARREKHRSSTRDNVQSGS